MAPLQIYWAGGSPFAWRVLACMEERGIPYEIKLLDISKQEHKCPEFLALNPRGQMPTLVDGDIVMCESLAALLYLEDAYLEDPLLPSGKKERALAYQRLVEGINLSDRGLACIRLKQSPNPDLADMQKAGEALKVCSPAITYCVHSSFVRWVSKEDELKHWDRHTKDGYAAGSNFTLADTAVGPAVLALKRYGASLKDYPNLAKYGDTVRARPSFSKTYPPSWKGTPNKDWLRDI